jgi:hypothetical protein
MTSQSACEELDRLNREVVSAILEAKAIRLSRDVSFQEDGALSRAANEKAEAVISHLLAGHGGKPCPAGDRPIVTGATQKKRLLSAHNHDIKISV